MLVFFRDFEVLPTIFWMKVAEHVESSVEFAIGLREEESRLAHCPDV